MLIEIDGDQMILAETESGGIVQLIETWQSVPRPLAPGHKGSTRRVRDPARVSVLLIHQTAVLGGFGATERQIDATPDHLPRYEREQVARQIRYRKTPYHGVYDPQASVSIVQWPVWAYMWHGNGGNGDSVGWAYDGKIPGDDLDVDAAREALRHMIDAARRQGAKLARVESHRQHSAARGGDPGAEIWRGVVLPVAAECGLGLSTRVTGSGQANPAAWG
jgi:hypothetical protein